jgi:protein-tyrosine phosphatase
MPSSSRARPFRVLFVCTGNICRSPMGQAMLTSRLRAALGDDADRLVEVSSAGTYGLVGHPIEPDALVALDELGVVPDEFAARELADDIVEASDLVLTATREHRAAAVSMLPRWSRRTFTIREFARLVDAVDVAAVTGDDPVARAAALVDAAAGQRGYVRPQTPDDDDVADPYRRPVDAFRVAAKQLDAATTLIAERLAQTMQPASS